jgi:hypothetical protein
LLIFFLLAKYPSPPGNIKFGGGGQEKCEINSEKGLKGQIKGKCKNTGGICVGCDMRQGKCRQNVTRRKENLYWSSSNDDRGGLDIYADARRRNKIDNIF